MWSIYARFKASSSPKRQHWKSESVKRYISIQDSGYFLDQFGDIRLHASRKMVENGSKALRGLTKGFKDDRKHVSMAESMCSSRLKSCACLPSKRMAELSPSKVSFPRVSCKMASTTARFLRTSLFTNPSFWSTYSNRTPVFGLTQFERECCSSRFELRPRWK